MQRFYVTTLAVVAAMMIAALMLNPSSEAGQRTSASATPDRIGHVAARHAGELVSESGMATEIARDLSGQFRINTVLNGTDAQFLIDTGADSVALTVEDAEAAGIDFDRESFEPMIRSASGVGKGAVVMIDRMEVAGREIENVEAVVIEGLDTNLLGQSLLRQLGSVQLQGDTMVIQPD